MQLNCPQCRADDSIAMEGNTLLCLACRHEWDKTRTYTVVTAPKETINSVAPTNVDVDRILAAATVQEVFAAPDLIDDPPIVETGPVGAADTQTDWAGQWIKHKDLTVERFCLVDDGTETITVVDDEGFELEWYRKECEVVDYDELALTPTVGAETVTEDQPFDPAIFATASLAITMGLMAVGDDPARTLYNPRIGWLPPPCNEVPEVEQGVAYAVAVLIQVFDLQRADVENIAATLMIASIPNIESDQQ